MAVEVEESTRVAQSNDDECGAFAALYDRYASRIHAFACHMLGDANQATDLTRETFLRAFRVLDRMEVGIEVGIEVGCDADRGTNAWLHRIAADACLDALRHRRRWIPWGGGRHRRPATDRAANPQRSPLAGVPARSVRDALQGMSPRNRLALILRDYAGFSCAELGAVLGVSPEATRAILFRSREEYRALQARLGEVP